MLSARMTLLDRRRFLRSLGALGAAAVSGCAAGAVSGRRLQRIGVQLYTVRAELQRDFEGTLARLAEIGYRLVEFAGYFGRTPAQVRVAVSDAGLTAPGRTCRSSCCGVIGPAPRATRRQRDIPGSWSRGSRNRSGAVPTIGGG